MHEIAISVDDLVSALLELSRREPVWILDSCGVGHAGSHLLIAGIRPTGGFELKNDDAHETLDFLDDKLRSKTVAVIFTISYDFGRKLHGIGDSTKGSAEEPDVFLAQFDSLVVHDYESGRTSLVGNSANFASLELVLTAAKESAGGGLPVIGPGALTSNFTKPGYLHAVDQIKERIRCGDTYQTNLSQQLRAVVEKNCTAQGIFTRLRKDHPAPFAAYLARGDSTVISASPERFFRIETTDGRRTIRMSPIKGTRRRGATQEEDAALKRELLASAKDIAENTMIVDLVRNDLGRVCDFGSVRVERLCDIEEHPSLFHLVSTVSGTLLKNASFSDVLRATFPCGSITGAPKLSTMAIIDDLEPCRRGLSMGAIGVYLPEAMYRAAGPCHFATAESCIDLSVAIRTMVIRDEEAIFNVGGGIVIDSDPDSEYEESLLKAQALLRAIGSSEFQL